MVRHLSVLAALCVACGPKTPPVVMVDGSLAACPSSPNCVSSLTEVTDTEHHIAPLEGTRPVDELVTWMASRKRCQVLDTGEDWVHAACKTAILRFTDDVALLVDENAGVTHVRSASRVGHSDFGKNRKRVEQMREEWAELP